MSRNLWNGGANIFAFLVSITLVFGFLVVFANSSPTPPGSGWNTGPPISGRNCTGTVSCPNICYFHPQLCNNSGGSTTIPTTSTISGGGAGSGGGGGGGVSYNPGSGTPNPVITQRGNCTFVSSFATGEQFGFLAGGTTFIIYNDYIGRDYANITINNAAYTIYQNLDVHLNGTNLELSLTGINSGGTTTISLSTCYSAITSSSTTVTSVPTTTVGAPPQTTIITSPQPPAPFSMPTTAPIVGGLALAGIGATRLRRRLVRGRKEHTASEPGIVRTVEELGVIDTALFISGVFAFTFGYILLAAVLSFAFGITLTYLLDHLRSRNAIMETIYERKDGLRKYIEEFGMIELLVFVIAALLLLKGYYSYGVLMFFVSGMLFAFFVDRIREVVTTIRKEIEAQDALSFSSVQQPPAQDQKPGKKTKKRPAKKTDENDFEYKDE